MKRVSDVSPFIIVDPGCRIGERDSSEESVEAKNWLEMLGIGVGKHGDCGGDTKAIGGVR